MNNISTILLDRDGVINYDVPRGIQTAEMWRAIPGSLEAIASLNRAGWQVFVLTNQSGIGRGYYDLSDFSDVNKKMMKELATVGGYIEEIFFCPHHPNDNCQCRKPRPGMFFQCQKKYKINLESVFYVGDKLSDVEAAVSAGSSPLLVMTGNGQDTLRNNPNLSIPYFTDLSKAVDYIMQQELI